MIDHSPARLASVAARRAHPRCMVPSPHSSHRRCRSWVKPLLAVGLLAGFCARAEGELVAFDFTAFVYNVDIPTGHPLEGSVELNDLISGRFRYDTDLDDQASQSTNFGSYLAIPAGQNSFMATGERGFVFNSSFTSNPFFAATVDDGNNFDTLLLNVSGDTTPSTLELPNTQFVEVGLLLETTITSTFASDALPENLPFQNFGLAGVDFFGSGVPFPTFLVQTTILSLEAVPVSQGDFDGDGDVDGLDLLRWQDGYGIASAATALDGDADADTDVDGADLLIWQQNFGTNFVANLSGVPEPTTAVLFALAGLSCFIGRKRLHGHLSRR